MKYSNMQGTPGPAQLRARDVKVKKERKRKVKQSLHRPGQALKF
jgi:hypothetical protein